MSDRMLKAALRYAALGWYVFPLATSGDIKRPHPGLGDTGGQNLASVDPDLIRRWWGRWPAAGIGVFCRRSGIVVVDIDPRHGGHGTIANLTAENGPLDSPVRGLTGGGGEHRIFACPEGVRHVPGRLGPRGGGVDLKWNGYIVVPPSPHPDGPRYRWAEDASPFGGNLDLLTYPPAWVLSGGDGAPAQADDQDDPFAEDTPVVGWTLDKLRETLFDVPNSGPGGELDYDDWFGVLSGVYHETGGSAEGRDLAYEWSSQATKHTDERFDKSWGSADITGKNRAPTTFRFVIKLAKEARGAKAAEAERVLQARIRAAPDLGELRAVANEIKLTDLDPLVRGSLTGLIRERYKGITGTLLPIGEARDLVRYEDPDRSAIPDWLKGWVYCARDDKFHLAGTGQFIAPRAFDSLFAVHMLSAKDIAEGRAVPEVSPSTAALNRYQVPKVHGRAYLPGEDEFFTFQGARYVNTYTAASVPPVPAVWTNRGRGAVKAVEAHFSHLIGDPQERSLVLSWLCSIVQSNTRPNWAVVLQGPEGDGKSFLVQLMGAVLGSENVSVLFAATIQESAFNAWAEGSQLTVIEEVKQHSQNRHVVLDRLQPLITNNVIQIHRKGVDPYPARNTAAYLLLTNHRDALPVGAGDTRYFMVASPRQTKAEVEAFKAANPGYFDRLFGALDDSPGAIRRWMLEFPLDPAFNPGARAPRSAEHARAAMLAKPELFSLIEEALAESVRPDVSPLLVDVAELREALHDHPADLAAIGRALLALGFSPLGRFRSETGERRRYWTSRPGLFSDHPAQVITDLLSL